MLDHHHIHGVIYVIIDLIFVVTHFGRVKRKTIGLNVPAGPCTLSELQHQDMRTYALCHTCNFVKPKNFQR